jgi:hypothetical protein
MTKEQKQRFKENIGVILLFGPVVIILCVMLWYVAIGIAATSAVEDFKHVCRMVMR